MLVNLKISNWENFMDFCELLNLRQSTRKFQSAPVKKEDIEKILAAADRAPVGSNRYEDIHLTVMEDQQKLLYLCEAAWKRFSSKAKIREIAGDTASEAELKKPNLFYDAPVVIFISHRKQTAQPDIEWANAAVIATIMHLEATNVGLGSVFMWGALESMRLFPELDHTSALELPEGFAPLLALAVGHPVAPLQASKKKHAPIGVNYVGAESRGKG